MPLSHTIRRLKSSGELAYHPTDQHKVSLKEKSTRTANIACGVESYLQRCNKRCTILSFCDCLLIGLQTVAHGSHTSHSYQALNLDVNLIEILPRSLVPTQAVGGSSQEIFAAENSACAIWNKSLADEIAIVTDKVPMLPRALTCYPKLKYKARLPTFITLRGPRR